MATLAGVDGGASSAPAPAPAPADDLRFEAPRLAAAASSASSALEKIDWTKADKIYEAFVAEELGEQSAADDLEQILDDLDLSYEMTADPRLAGGDPLNRKLMEKEVPPLMLDVWTLGFSAKQCAHALLSEEVPGKTDIEDHNIKLTDGSEFLAPVRQGELRFGALSCQHFLAGLRAIKLAAPSKEPGMTTDGVWDLDKIRAKSDGHRFAQAIENGIRCKIVRWPVRQQRPLFLKLIQEARNLASHTGRPVSETEVLSNLHTMYVQEASRPDAVVDWARLKRAALRSRPPAPT